MPPQSPTPQNEGIDALVRTALERHANGDPTAKNDLLTHTKTQFTRMARKLLRGVPRYERLSRWEETDDVVQGLMMRMLDAIDHVKRFESPRHFFKLAAKNIHWELKGLLERNTALKRNIGKLKSDIQPAPDGESAVVGKALGNVPARKDHLAELSRYLDEMETVSADDRELLDLVLVNSLTNEEAAAHLEMSLATFKRHYRAARLRLRGHFIDDGKKHG